MKNSERILIEYYIRNHPVQATRVLERLPAEETAEFLNTIPAHLLQPVFKLMQRHTAARCLERLDVERSAMVIEKLPVQVVSVILRVVEPDPREKILNAVAKDFAEPLRRILSYPEDSAGAIADPSILTLPDDITVGDAREYVQKFPQNSGYYLYIIDRSQTLTGVITMRELFSARSMKRISDYNKEELIFLSANLTIPSVLNHPGWRYYSALPVIGDGGILLGVLNYETFRRLEKETKKSHLTLQAIEAGNALGELFQIGLTGLLQSAAATFTERIQKK